MYNASKRFNSFARPTFVQHGLGGYVVGATSAMASIASSRIQPAVLGVKFDDKWAPVIVVNFYGFAVWYRGVGTFVKQGIRGELMEQASDQAHTRAVTFVQIHTYSLSPSAPPLP